MCYLYSLPRFLPAELEPLLRLEELLLRLIDDELPERLDDPILLRERVDDDEPTPLRERVDDDEPTPLRERLGVELRIPEDDERLRPEEYPGYEDRPVLLLPS